MHRLRRRKSGTGRGNAQAGRSARLCCAPLRDARQGGAGPAPSTPTAEATGTRGRRPDAIQQALPVLVPGRAYVTVDGTPLACDRPAADLPFYSGKHKHHGMNIQVVAALDGELPQTAENALNQKEHEEREGESMHGERIPALPY